MVVCSSGWWKLVSGVGVGLLMVMVELEMVIVIDSGCSDG